MADRLAEFVARSKGQPQGDRLAAFVSRHRADTFQAGSDNGAGKTDIAGAGQAALEHYGNAATLGYLPQIQAMVGKAMPDPGADVDEKLRAQGFQVSSPQEKSYVDLRDENLQRLEKQGREFPKASMAGTGAGILAGALLTNRLIPITGAPSVKYGGQVVAGPATRAAYAGKNIAQAAKIGGTMGAIANPGDVEGEVNPIQIDGRGKNALIGAIVGGLVQGGVEAAGPLLTAVRNWAGKKAARKATRALGRPTPTQAARMAETGQDVTLGRELLDEGAIPVLGTPGRIQGRVEVLKEKAGKQIGQIVDSAGDAKLIDAEKIAIDILDSPELAQLRRTPGMEGAVAAIEKQVETLAKNGQLTVKEAQALRQGIDRSINFNKAVPDMRGAQEGLYMQRTAVRNAMNEGINSLPNAPAKDALLTANRKYGNLSEASDILEREVGRQQANRAISLTDTIAGAAGATTGSPLASLALGALNKAGRTFGNSIQARGLDAASKAAGKGAVFAGSAAKQSPAVQAMLNRLLVPGGKFQESEYRDFINNPKLMQQFQADPSLIEAVQDDKLRAAIIRQIGRNPAGSAMQRRLGQ